MEWFLGGENFINIDIVVRNFGYIWVFLIGWFVFYVLERSKMSIF